MNCERLLKLLNDFVDDDLEPTQCAQLQAHLRDCQPCRVVVDNVRNTIHIYRGAAELCALPLKFRNCLHAALRAKWEGRQRPPGSSPGRPTKARRPAKVRRPAKARRATKAARPTNVRRRRRPPA